MTLTVNVKENFDDIRAQLKGYQQDQLPFATSLALNRTADFVKSEAARAAKASLSAKPFTTSENAFYVVRSNKRNLRVEIGYKTIQARYMRWLTGGGQRVAKGFEVKLQAMGILPKGYVTVPGAAIKLDSYGNIPNSMLGAILGQLAASIRVFAGRGKKAHGEALFVVKPNNQDPRTKRLQPGIWQRIESGGQSAIRPLILFVTHAQYRPGKFFDFDGIASKAAVIGFQREFPRALEEAMRTAR